MNVCKNWKNFIVITNKIMNMNIMNMNMNLMPHCQRHDREYGNHHATSYIQI